MQSGKKTEQLFKAKFFCYTALVVKGATRMEYFDVCAADGLPTGEIVSRERAHRDGIPHRTAHVWIIRKENGRVQVLLQKRSRDKDSFPGLYDTSSAGHIPAGDEPLPSALRELREELGITARPEALQPAGHFHIHYEKNFHGKPFRDEEYASVYVYAEPVDIGALTLQPEEVEAVCWYDFEQLRQELPTGRDRFCVPTEGLRVLQEWLASAADPFSKAKE